MEREKRFGLIAIASAIFLAAASFVFSENACYPGGAGDSWLNLLLICLRLNIYEEVPGYPIGLYLYVPTKYLLLACIALLAVGALWHKGALPIPSRKAEPKTPKPPSDTGANDA